jgi:hypothetical protein
MQPYITGFFKLIGQEGEVAIEVPSTGRAKADYLALDQALRKRFPNLKIGQFKRVNSRVALKAANVSDDIIDPTPGMTLRNLFADHSDNGAESFRNVGTVFFKGSNYHVTLRYLRAKACVGLALTPLVGGTPVRFTNQIQAGILVDELDRLIREILGNDGRDLKLRTRVATKPPNESTHKPGEPRKAVTPRSSLKG